MSSICKNIEKIKQEIILASKNGSLVQKNVKIIAVSKNQTIDKIEEAINCGQIDFAENYIQEAEEKWIDLKKKYPQVKLHLIGHLQSNKAKKALELFDVIHSLDSLSLAKKLSNIIKENNLVNKSFLIQILLDKDSVTKHGLPIDDLPDLLNQCKELNLEVNGFMAVAPHDITNIPVAPYFAFIKHLANRYSLNEISMGMSGDYKTALRFGSTMIRVGTGIFGSR